MTSWQRRRFASSFEFELFDARDKSNRGMAVVSRPDEKLVMWERKSLIEREADVFLRDHGVRGVRIGRERRHDTTRGASILTEAQRDEIVHAYRDGMTQTAIGHRYGVSRRLIFNVLKGLGSDGARQVKDFAEILSLKRSTSDRPRDISSFVSSIYSVARAPQDPA